MLTQLKIQLLDSFQIRFGGTAPEGFHQPRLQSLLAYLLLHRGTPQPRQKIAFAFWPDSTEKQARTNLRGLLLSLRKSLPNAEQHLALTPETICWIEDGPYTLDVATFETALDEANRTRQPAHKKQRLQKAVDAYAGELLPGFYDDWILVERERLADLYRNALVQLADLHEEERNYSAAITLTDRLLVHDPLSEVAHQRLIHLHLLNEDRAAALRAYHHCATVLREELGVDPGPAIQELHTRLLRLEDERGAGDEAKPAAPSSAIPLVGRHAEWTQLTQWWQHSQKGYPQLVVIEGEAGIGKTRLAEELVDIARRQGMVALHTRAYAAEGAAAYTPVVELLRSQAVHTQLEQLDDLWLTELARLLPELLTDHPELPHPLPMNEEWQRRRFQEALVRGCLAAGQPLLLHCDDLQWWDGETLAWLQTLLNFKPDGRILVVGTVRTGEADSSHPLHQLKAEFVRADRCQTLSLNPLSPEEVTSLTAAIRQEDEATLDSAQLYAETEGSPLFTVELARTTSDTQADVAPIEVAGFKTTKTKLPPKLESVITSRLAQLSDPARELLRVAAVIGRSFTYEILAASAQRDEDTLVDALDELWTRQIIREQGGEQYDFSHDRIREVAYGEISGARRRLLHRRVAEGLACSFTKLTLDQATSLAHHYLEAGVLEKAVTYFQTAGDKACTLHSLQEALGYYERAMLIATDGVQRDDILSRKLLIYLDLYQGEKAIAGYERLIENARQRQQYAQELTALLGLGRAYYIAALNQPTSGAIDQSWESFASARKLARELNDNPNLVRALTGTRWHCIFSRNYLHQTGTFANEAVEVSQKLGDPELEWESFIAQFHHTNPKQWIPRAEKFRIELEERKELTKLNELYFYLMLIHTLGGNFISAVEYCNAGINLADDIGIAPIQYYALKAQALINLGRYDCAWQALDKEIVADGYSLASAYKTYIWAQYHRSILAEQKALMLFTQVRDQAQKLNRPWLLAHVLVELAILYSQDGPCQNLKSLKSVEAELTDVIAMDNTIWSQMVGLPIVARSEMALARGDLTSALEMVEQAIDLAEGTGRRPDYVLATELKMRTLIKLGRPNEAVGLFDEGFKIAKKIGYKPKYWRLWATLAKAQCHLGQNGMADDVIEIVHDLAASIPDAELRHSFLAHDEIRWIQEQITT